MSVFAAWLVGGLILLGVVAVIPPPPGVPVLGALIPLALFWLLYGAVLLARKR
jgi:hypothetical protein